MELVSGKVVQGCSNAGNPFHECTSICLERLNSGDVHKIKDKRLFGFGKRTPSRETPPGSPARGIRSPMASYFGKKKVESESSPSNDHTNVNFFNRLSPLQERKTEPANNVDSLPISPSLSVYSGGDYFAARTDLRGCEDNDMSPRPFGTHPKTPEHPLRTPQHRPRTPQHHTDPRPWAQQEDPISLETRPRTPERPSNTSNTRPRTPAHVSATAGRRTQTPESKPRTPIHESAAIERRPQTPGTRTSTPGRPSDTRLRTPIHESVAIERRPQTPETRPRAAQHRGRSPEFMARSLGPRSKTPEPQPTLFEPLSRTPKPRSKTPEPSPRITQSHPISHRPPESAYFQTPTRPRMPVHQPKSVETRPIMDESRPKTADYRGNSSDHKEKISQTQAYSYLGSKAVSVYTDNDNESVLLYPELIVSPQERPNSRPITPNHRGYETPTKHFDQLDDFISTDDDIFSFVDEEEDSSVWFYPEITQKSGTSTPVNHESRKLRCEQEEQEKANNEPPELPDETQSFSLSEITRMKGIVIKKSETRDEMQSILSESQVSVGDYKVRASVSATLQHILDKHGDIASASKLQSIATRSYYLDMLASVVLELQTTPLKHLKESRVEEMVAIVRDVESVKIKAGWLKQVLEEIVEAVKHYDEEKKSRVEKEEWEGDVLLARQEMEKQVKELREKEKKMKEWREGITEMAGKLGTLEIKRERLQKSLAFLSSKVDKFQGQSVLQGIF